MVLYFSATGNTRYVAMGLARCLDDDVLDVCRKIKGHDYEALWSDKPFVLCAPTYVCEAPAFFYDFVRRTELLGNADMYMISTSGGYSGISGIVARSIAREKGMNYMGHAEFRMSPNYIANKSHKLPDEDEIRKRIADADCKIEEVADVIRNGGKLRTRHLWALEVFIDHLSNPVLGAMGHRVKGFHVNDRCISCGMCEERCPLNIITIRDGVPRWDGDTCAHCMACIQNCPTGAIEYKDITQGRKRYRIEDYLE